MSDFSKNKGILVTGGTFKAGNAAVGDGARAIRYQQAPSASEPASLSELRVQLQALIGVLEARRAEIPASAEVLDSVRGAEEEVAKEKPRRGVVLSLLERVATGVAGLVDVAGVMSPLIQAAGRLIH